MSSNRQLEDAIFFAAVHMTDPQLRAAFLDQACLGDPGLRSLVEEMLASQDQAERMLENGQAALQLTPEEATTAVSEQSATDSAPEDKWIGARVGQYKILQRIGEGGCGLVYMVEQITPVRRRVALKIIKLGMDTKSVVARFDEERQALALMDHSNIARVLDVGATDSGRPYFVMELVHGTRITEFCDENKLGMRQRLELFIQVCHAIQHAHQKGIVHRDIKPSNILVTIMDGKPVPKVIDFGIAKAIEGPLTDNTVFTAYEQFIGTPAYMSPEQAIGSAVDVDTRSDIYSLGVLLYELLTGRTPFELRELMKEGVDGLRRTLQECEPLRPSVAMTTMEGAARTQVAAHRQSEPLKLISQLRGDLDWVVIRALEKDRSRRYQTANGLAMDVRRYLDNEPIVARPPSQLYRFQKLVRRNRAVFVSAAAISLALIAGFGTSTWLFFKEREARREAQRGREAEASLRQKAEAREIIARAVSLIEKNQFEKADQLVGNLPSSDAADVGVGVFRPLGDWAVQNGNWRRAAEYYSVVVRLDQFERIGVSFRDYTRYAVVLAEQGNYSAYEKFCREQIKRFGKTTDPTTAERIIKNSLLLPPSSKLLADLAPLAARVEQAIPTNIFNSTESAPYNDAVAWRCMALALINYRGDDYANAARWSTLGLKIGTGRVLARDAYMQAILAMSDHRLGRDAEARLKLARCQQEIAERFKTPFANADEGLDWFLARLLQREAAVCIEEVPSVSQ